MKHPYIGLPDRQFWKKDPGINDLTLLDPVSDAPFQISKGDRIVTAGSCFAQHVARHLAGSGFNHHITERAHPIISDAVAARHNYGVFAARYGNIYTARQLRQLFDRAYARFAPKEDAWAAREPSRVVDPFRPNVQPGGYLSAAELRADRAFHFQCVRDALEQADVFVFTLGLTEAWEDIRDGAVFPLAPGVAGGEYNPTTVRFVNFDLDQTSEDLENAFNFLRSINPTVKIILTVSPVALNATYENRHVLLSTTWSKAVLRLAAEKAAQTLRDCAYFPSYEIITSPHARGAYFAEDAREVTAKGVDHVMGLFLKHFAADSDAIGETQAPAEAHGAAQHNQAMDDIVDAFCDEAQIDNK